MYNHGYSMMEDLVGKTTFFQVLLLSVTGRLPERRLAEWIEAVFICMSYPDARIWCNQVGSLAGTMQSTSVAGACAGILATDSHLYGVGPLLAGTRFIVDALAKKKMGMSAEDIVREQQRRPGSTPIITGYIRPVASGDERIAPLERLAARLGFAREEHLILAFEISEVMEREFNEGINLNGYVNAFLSDQGYTVEEIYRIFVTVACAGILACHAEAADNPPGTFFPLRCEDIDYQGVSPRSVPDRD